MASSGYTAITFVANEQPTTAKWNLIGSNDASFNNGNGFEDSIIVARHVANQAVLPPKLKTPYNYISYFFNPGYTTTSGSPTDITGMTRTITTQGGGLMIYFSLPVKVSTNTATVYVTIDGTANAVLQTSTLSTLYIPCFYKVDGLSAGSHTIKLQCSIPGGATFTCQQYESGTLMLFELGNS